MKNTVKESRKNLTRWCHSPLSSTHSQSLPSYSAILKDFPNTCENFSRLPAEINFFRKTTSSHLDLWCEFGTINTFLKSRKTTGGTAFLPEDMLFSYLRLKRGEARYFLACLDRLIGTNIWHAPANVNQQTIVRFLNIAQSKEDCKPRNFSKKGI